jgi:hypothetical protein
MEGAPLPALTPILYQPSHKGKMNSLQECSLYSNFSLPAQKLWQVVGDTVRDLFFLLMKPQFSADLGDRMQLADPGVWLLPARASQAGTGIAPSPHSLFP